MLLGRNFVTFLQRKDIKNKNFEIFLEQSRKGDAMPEAMPYC